ncbi:MAG: ASPIC/UnbV domain-containing protein [Caldilineae bacterium]|nr:ASPIC/UnbV domain-containing protein [Chloroflexota bacterium]MCB9176554.1 ASPIC/UnbV domain-containing protein [Caldilineae bacterium]
MASDSEGETAQREAGHQNHFRLLSQEGQSWSGREPDVLFQNRGDGTFDEVGNLVGVASRLDSRGAATGDLDGDGDLELVVMSRNNPILKIYRNDTPASGRVLLVDLVGGAAGTGAIGAQAVARCGDTAVLRQVTAGSGYLAQSASTLHFGLGACEGPARLDILWPGGERQSVEGLEVDHRYRIAQGEEAVQAQDLRERNYNAGEVPPPAGEISAPLPEVNLDWLDDAGSFAPAAAEGIHVLNFWATWCTACIAEMPDLEALSAEFGPQGVDVVGLIMDERDLEAEVRDFATARGVTYAQAWGTIDFESQVASIANAPAGAIPLTAIVEDGLVRYTVAGRIDPDDMARRLTALLGD